VGGLRVLGGLLDEIILDQKFDNIVSLNGFFAGLFMLKENYSNGVTKTPLLLQKTFILLSVYYTSPGSC
jgi:hypothetical protein